MLETFLYILCWMACVAFAWWSTRDYFRDEVTQAIRGRKVGFWHRLQEMRRRARAKPRRTNFAERDVL